MKILPYNMTLKWFLILVMLALVWEDTWGFDQRGILPMQGDEFYISKLYQEYHRIVSEVDAESPEEFVHRCGLPYQRMFDEVEWALSAPHREALNEILGPPPFKMDNDSLEVHKLEHISASGLFRIVYRLDGPDSVSATDSSGSGIPDYVEWTAAFADYAFFVQVDSLGFIDPTKNRGLSECPGRKGSWQDTLITIYYRNSPFYGGFRPSEPFAFFVHSHFDGFPHNTDPEGNVRGALRVTVAHELKHVIQYATNCYRGDAGSTAWLEMDATMMENIVFPQVNDYYNYLDWPRSVFSDPGITIPSYEQPVNAYSHVSWMLYFSEFHGAAFWVDVWDRIGISHFKPMFKAMQESLIDRGETLETALIRNHLWHFASGSRSIGLESPDIPVARWSGSGPSRTHKGSELSRINSSTDYSGIRNGSGQKWINIGPDPASINNHSGPVFKNSDPASEKSSSFMQPAKGIDVWRKKGSENPGYGFSERMAYPDARVDSTFRGPLARPVAERKVAPRAARYHEFILEEGLNEQIRGPVSLVLFQHEPVTGLGVLFRERGGEIHEFILPAASKKTQKYQFPVHWENLEWMGVVSVNAKQADTLSHQLFVQTQNEVEAFYYGSRNGMVRPRQMDALWILDNQLYAGPITPFEHFLTDVTGNGTVSAKDAAWIYRVLESSTGDESRKYFPVDINRNEKGPEREKFNLLLAGDSLLVNGNQEPDPWPDEPDTVTVTLRIDSENGEAVAESLMDLVFEIGGNSSRLWYSMYLDLEIAYPKMDDDEIPDSFVLLHLTDLELNSASSVLYQGIRWDMNPQRLRMAVASAQPLGEFAKNEEWIRLRFFPENDGFVHFRISELKLDEYSFVLDHPLMDTVRVGGVPVRAESGNTGPPGLVLEQNYPNPFNSQTRIVFYVSEPGPVQLSIYDATGRRVTTLIDEKMSGGRHQAVFDAGGIQGISSGVYLYRLKTAENHAVRKMILIQ